MSVYQFGRFEDRVERGVRKIRRTFSVGTERRGSNEESWKTVEPKANSQ